MEGSFSSFAGGGRGFDGRSGRAMEAHEKEGAWMRKASWTCEDGRKSKTERLGGRRIERAFEGWRAVGESDLQAAL